jgi:O-antigen/teichoic acid export membrane protein
MQNALALTENLFREALKTWRHEGFQKYFRNTGWLFLGRIFALGAAFFVGVYIARYLGPANYGLFNYVISFVGLFSFIVSLGIDNILNREIIKDHSKKDSLIGTAFYLKIFGSLLAIFFVFIISFFTTQNIFMLGLIWIFSLNFIPQAFNVIETYFQSQVLAKNVVRAQIFSSLIAIILKILVIVFNKGIFWLTLIFVLETFLYGIFLLYTFRKYGNRIRDWKFDKHIAMNLLKDSWPLMFSGLAVGIYMKIDQVMIQNMLGSEQVGLYAVAVKLSEVWYFIPSLICISIFPAIINALKNNSNEFKKRIGRLFFSMFWIAMIISIFITIFSNIIIKILFGNEYLLSIPILQIHIWSTVGAFTSMALGNYLNSKNLNIILLYSTILGAILNIILNIILISKLGVSGAAIATLISYSSATLSIFLFKKSDLSLKRWLISIITYK